MASAVAISSLEVIRDEGLVERYQIFCLLVSGYKSYNFSFLATNLTLSLWKRNMNGVNIFSQIFSFLLYEVCDVLDSGVSRMSNFFW